MKIALINVVKPQFGSGDGLTEYTYQLYSKLKHKASVTTIYALDKLKRFNITGLIYTNTVFKNRVLSSLNGNFDIVHITNHELGFIAKIIKQKKIHAKVITTIFDLSRFRRDIYSSILQKQYNKMVKGSIKDAIVYSDYLILGSTQTKNEINKNFRGILKDKQYCIIGAAIGDKFFKKRKMSKISRFTVGYVGSLAEHKNVVMLFRTMKLLKGSNIKLKVYGTGVTKDLLRNYKQSNALHNIDILGFAPENRKVEIYDSFDAFVFPSVQEGFGMPILEAQARGLPVIIYKKGKIPKEVRKYCFEAVNEKDMAGIIKNLKKKGYSKKQKDKATAYAKTFTWNKVAEDTLGVYKKLM